MKWRTDKPTANKIVALISDGGGYDVLYRRDDGEYVYRYDEPPYSTIEKWADLEEDETATDCNELLEVEVQNYQDKDYPYIKCCDMKTYSFLLDFASHFAKWGAEHLKK